MGLGTIGWGFGETDGVPVVLVESQQGCLENQWGRLSMGMLQGVCGQQIYLWVSFDLEHFHNFNYENGDYRRRRLN